MCAAPVNLTGSQNIVAEDVSVLKLLAASLPIVGLAISLFQQHSLLQQIESASAPRVIQLIKVKNDYIGAELINSILTCALNVMGLAKGILPTGLLFGTTGTIISGCFVFAAIFMWRFYHLSLNQRSITDIQTTGRMPPGLTIY